MKKIIIWSFLLVLTFSSCNNSEKEKEFLQKEIEIAKKEKALESKLEALEIKENNIDLNKEIQANIIHCQNEKFIIKVDKLKNDEIRYISWNKPKTIIDKPDLILYDGEIEKQGTGGGYHYIFKNGVWNYIIENNFMGESSDAIGIFLSLKKNNEQKLFKKMNDLTVKENYDLKSYSEGQLIGEWWTPHFAVRKINLFNNNTFIYNPGDDEIFNGKYSILENSLYLEYDNGLDKILKIGGGKNNTSYTLTGGGENFIKPSI